MMKLTGMRKGNGFTLIELLIVVAILSILASIAVQNMLNAKVRAQVARVQSEHRSLATALGAFDVDNGFFPLTELPLEPRNQRLAPLTTPMIYINSLPREVFVPEGVEAEVYPYWSPGLNDAMKMGTMESMYYYLNEEKYLNERWALFSRGPDMDYEIEVEEGGGGFLMYYDPTNGTRSNGDIMRFGP